MKDKILVVSLVAVCFFNQPAAAFLDGSIVAGLSYFSENAGDKTSQKPDGSTAFLGEPNYPISLKYDVGFAETWFFAPQVLHTPLPRESAGKSAKVTLTHLALQFGQNFATSAESTFDWYFGPGLLNREIKGKGGTVDLSNGTGTSTFAVPGRTSTTRKVTANFGTSFTYARTRLGLDLIFENLFTSKNESRSQSLMLNLAYQFGGGF